MGRIFDRIAALFTARGASRTGAASPLDYDRMFILDAEELAEAGICDAYEEIRPTLAQYVEAPAEVVEEIDDKTPSYRVSAAGRTHGIYGPDLDEDGAGIWGRATVVLFDIVNSQLGNAEVKFYAINGGNDLGGVFLTEAEVEAARSALNRKTDWPYLPALEHPWFGQHH